MRFLPPVLTIMLCVSAVSTAPGAPAPAAPAIARDSAADSTRISAAQSLDTVPRLVKLTGTFVGFDLLSNSIIIENARQLYDTLVLSQNAVVSCADAIGALGDIKAGNALTLACRKYRGNRTVLSIRKKGCATGEPPPPTSMQPASTLACRKYRGNRTVLSIRKKGCATGEPPPPTSMQPASTPVPAETHR